MKVKLRAYNNFCSNLAKVTVEKQCSKQDKIRPRLSVAKKVWTTY